MHWIVVILFIPLSIFLESHKIITSPPMWTMYGAFIMWLVMVIQGSKK